MSEGEHPMMGPGRERLVGKVAVITGANAGIGRAAARLFAREGARVVCVDVQMPATARVDHLITADGGDALFVQSDVSTKVGCVAMVDAAIATYGGVDILVNNAGDGIKGKLHELSEADWFRIIDLNLNSVYHGVRAILPYFLAMGHGNIINTASTFGVLATDAYGAYCASKAAVINLTRQLAIDYGPSIRVNCVCPGATGSPRLLARIAAAPDPEARMERMKASNYCLRRLGRPEEIAYAMLFLASDESSFVTGQPLIVDGGQLSDA